MITVIVVAWTRPIWCGPESRGGHKWLSGIVLKLHTYSVAVQSQWDDANLSGRLLSCLINKGILRTRASAEKFRLKTTKQHTVDSRPYSPAGILQMANLYHPPLCLSVLPGSSFGLYRALSEIRANALPLCAHCPLSVISEQSWLLEYSPMGGQAIFLFISYPSQVPTISLQTNFFGASTAEDYNYIYYLELSSVQSTDTWDAIDTMVNTGN